jgi:hypothetical protein
MVAVSKLNQMQRPSRSHAEPDRTRQAMLNLTLILATSASFSVVPPLVPPAHAAQTTTKEAANNMPSESASKVAPAKNATLPPPFPIGNKVSRTVQQVTGINWLTGVVAGKVAGAVIHHKVGGKVKVKVKTYSFTDLMAGKVKAVDVSLKNAQVEGVQVGSVHASVKNPVWFSPFKGKNKKRGLNNPVNISVAGDVSKEDVTKALATQEITKAIRGFKLDLPGLGDAELEVLKPQVEIEKGLVKIAGTLVTKGASEDTGVPLKIEATPKLVANNEIVLDNLKVESALIVEPEKFSAFISDLINPIVRFSRYDRKTHAFRLLALDVNDDLVKGEGNLLLVPKDYKPQVAKPAPSM